MQIRVFLDNWRKIFELITELFCVLERKRNFDSRPLFDRREANSWRCRRFQPMAIEHGISLQGVKVPMEETQGKFHNFGIIRPFVSFGLSGIVISKAARELVKTTKRRNVFSGSQTSQTFLKGWSEVKKLALALVFGGLILSGLGIFSPAKTKAAEFSVQTSRGGFYLNTNRPSGNFPRNFNSFNRSFNQPQIVTRQVPVFVNRQVPVYVQQEVPVQRHFSSYPQQNHYSHGPSFTVTPHGNHFHVTPSIPSNYRRSGYWRP